MNDTGRVIEAVLYAHRTLANGPAEAVCACDRTWRPNADYRAHLASRLVAAIESR